MGFTVQYDPKNRCVIGRFMGSMEEETTSQYMRAIAGAGQELNCKFYLNDLSQATIDDFTTLDIFNLPQTLKTVGIDHSWKRAILFAKDFPKFRFIETRMINEGQPVRIFQDRKAAIKWLKEGREE